MPGCYLLDDKALHAHTGSARNTHQAARRPAAHAHSTTRRRRKTWRAGQELAPRTAHLQPCLNRRQGCPPATGAAGGGDHGEKTAGSGHTTPAPLPLKQRHHPTALCGDKAANSARRHAVCGVVWPTAMLPKSMQRQATHPPQHHTHTRAALSQEIQHISRTPGADRQAQHNPTQPPHSAPHTHATPTYGAGACTSTPATHTAPGSTQVVLTSGCVHDVGSWCTHRKQPRKAERGGGKQRSGDEKEGCVLRWVHGGRPSVQSWKPVSSVFRQPCRGVTAPHVLIGCVPASPTVTQR